MQRSEQQKFERLRQEAEQILKKHSALPEHFSRREFDQMIHDLQVHQIELELQNEDLLYAQQMVEESRNRYAFLFNQAPVGYLTIDLHSIIYQCNETFARMTGRNIADITGKSLGEFLALGDRAVFHGRFNAFFKSPAGKTMELMLEPFHSRSFPVRLTGRFDDGVEKTADRSSQKLLLIIHDITAEKENEEALRKSQEELKQIIAVKNKFFSIIAHDLRGPFTSLLGYTELMEKDDGSMTAGEFRKYAGSLRRTAVNLFNLLENLLDWAQIQQGNTTFDPTTIDICNIVQAAAESVRPTAEQKEITVTADMDVAFPVYADRMMIETAVRNILFNAVKFTHRGGCIHVTCAKTESHVSVYVRDNGTGMTPDMVAKLFRPDVKIKTRGTEGEPSTGLGLILCHEYVAKNGGTITVESESGKGSTFTISLPAGEPVL